MDDFSYIVNAPYIMWPTVLFAGLVFGSFVTLATHRLPKDEDIFYKRSQCGKCEHVLGILDLFPLFSWLVLGGKCRYCRVPISARYPCIELVQMALFAVVYGIYGATGDAVILMLLSVCILTAIIIDFEHYILPDGLNISMGILAVVYQWLHGAAWEQFIIMPFASVALGLTLRAVVSKMKQQEALGLGDVKFLFVAGLFLSPELFITFLFLAGVIGIVTAVLWRLLGKGDVFPFGPALCVSLFLCLLFPSIPGELYGQMLRLSESYLYQ
jgi:prepilin signal peptidase PulO-like enzyme (type II secretory pathway)